MKKPKDIEDLTSRLTKANHTPLVPPPAEPPSAVKKKAGQGSASVFLRLPRALHDKARAEAITRTKATGEAVNVQQIIIEKLEATL